MRIIVPWKPVVLVWGLLSGMIFFGFVASSVLQGKDPFAPGATITAAVSLENGRCTGGAIKALPQSASNSESVRTSEISACRFVCLAFSVTSRVVYLPQYFLQLLLQDDLRGRTSLASEP